MLADFSFTPPEQILEQLLMDGYMAGMHMHDIDHLDRTADEIKSTPHVAMESGGHLNDVKYDAFLANDRTLADPQASSGLNGREIER